MTLLLIFAHDDSVDNKLPPHNISHKNLSREPTTKLASLIYSQESNQTSNNPHSETYHDPPVVDKIRRGGS
jgi:hypothetical protein